MHVVQTLCKFDVTGNFIYLVILLVFVIFVGCISRMHSALISVRYFASFQKYDFWNRLYKHVDGSVQGCGNSIANA